MTPLEHSILSVRDFGGIDKDYIKFHEFMDQSKLHYSDWKHRAVLHHTLGIAIGEQMFGPGFRNSDGVVVSTREILRRHIIQDMGSVPTVKDWFRYLKMSDRNFRYFTTPNKKDLEYLKKINRPSQVPVT